MIRPKLLSDVFSKNMAESDYCKNCLYVFKRKELNSLRCPKCGTEK